MSETIKRLNGLHQKRDELLLAASQWPTERLQFQSPPGTWCALEVLNHLARAERDAARQMRINLRNRTRRPARTTSSQLVLLAIMRSPLRVKVPKGAEYLHPSTPESLDHAINEWKCAGSELTTVLREITQEEEKLGVFQHPIGGWMNAQSTVRFLRLHLDHHCHQWSRLTRAIS